VTNRGWPDGKPAGETEGSRFAQKNTSRGEEKKSGNGQAGPGTLIPKIFWVFKEERKDFPGS